MKFDTLTMTATSLFGDDSEDKLRELEELLSGLTEKRGGLPCEVLSDEEVR
jgi:hypothetical protein